ncbi:MAG: NAD(P)-dependent oxidoreductase [Flavobacteriales bacterium]|nr:NAD(P)-dependent oxidoreductase [Flavobacteriales bacterium]
MSRVALITGGSRGIGRAIALKLASNGYSIVIAAKSTEEDPRIPGTIHTVAKEVEELGGKALAVKVDIRSEEQVVAMFEQVKKTFGHLDVLVNNASAINLSNTERMEMKRWDLMNQINVRGTYMVSKYAISLLKEGTNAHILTLSPPLNLDKVWFAKHLGYTMAKYGMSMTVLGLAAELKQSGIAVNALWPRTTIATAAVQNLLGGDQLIARSRKPEIVADAAWTVVNKNSANYTGRFLIDEEVLRESGITDFDQYAVNPGGELMPDLFL